MNMQNTMIRPSFEILARTRLPIVTGKIVDAVVFGSDPANPDVIALVHKKPDTTASHALVRLHSACITSEVLGSTKCDCANQLDTAINMISQSEWGVLVYLLGHEGRGIGLVNKIRAYALQDQGLDTIDANLALGFGADDRDFDPAVQTLRLLGIKRIALLTNNPEKETVLRAAGIEICERIAMDVPIHEHNRSYLLTKRRLFGHLPHRDPSTEFLTAEAAYGVFEQEASKARQGVSTLVLRIDSVREAETIAIAEEQMTSVALHIKRNSAFDAACVARMGDDIFLVLLPDVSASIAQEYGNQLCSSLGADDDEKGRLALQAPMPITLSVTWHASGTGASHIIGAAMATLKNNYEPHPGYTSI